MIYLVTNQILPESCLFELCSVEKSLELLEPLKVVGLDTETMGMDPYTRDLIMLQLGCFEYQVVIDLTTVDINFYKKYLESDRLFIGWNIKFDLKFLFHKRIVVRNVYDGFLAEKLLYQGFPSGIHSMSLKSAGENYLGVELDKTVRGKVMWAGLSEDVVAYGANDVKFLEGIMNAQRKKLERQGLVVALEYENKSVPWLINWSIEAVLPSVIAASSLTNKLLILVNSAGLFTRIDSYSQLVRICCLILLVKLVLSSSKLRLPSFLISKNSFLLSISSYE